MALFSAASPAERLRSAGSLATNRFHVSVHLVSSAAVIRVLITAAKETTVHLSSNRSQMTSKCGKNKNVAHEAIIASCATENRPFYRAYLVKNYPVLLSRQNWLEYCIEKGKYPRGRSFSVDCTECSLAI